MAFFNLTMCGYQNVFKEFGRSKTDLVSLPRISNSTSDLSAFKQTKSTTITTKPLDSNLKYHELRTKHVRSNQGPTQNLKRPLTCSHEVGWWTRHEPIKDNLSWTFVEKRVFPKSEMTSFADKMCLADKSFKMY